MLVEWQQSENVAVRKNRNIRIDNIFNIKKVIICSDK